MIYWSDSVAQYLMSKTRFGMEENVVSLGSSRENKTSASAFCVILLTVIRIGVIALMSIKLLIMPILSFLNIAVTHTYYCRLWRLYVDEIMAYLCFEIWLTASLVSLVYHQNNCYFREKQPTLLEEARSCNWDVDHPLLNNFISCIISRPQDMGRALLALLFVLEEALPWLTKKIFRIMLVASLCAWRNVISVDGFRFLVRQATTSGATALANHLLWASIFWLHLWNKILFLMPFRDC